jgi:hypothetical protein
MLALGLLPACQQILGIENVKAGALDGGADLPPGPTFDGNSTEDGGADAGDAPPAPDGPTVPDDADADADAGPPDAEAPDTGADRPVCMGMAIACGVGCINPATSAMHCGGCNHPCGGGTCMMGICQPATIIDGMHVNDLTVDASGIYFTVGKRVLHCPKNGCGALAPTQIADMPMETSFITAANGNVLFVSAPGQNTIRPTLYVCPQTGCPTPVPAVSNPSFSGPSEVVPLGDDVYWIDPDGGLRKRTCGANGGACAAVVQIAPRGVIGLSASPTEVFFRDTMANGFGLAKCPNTGCPAAPAVPTKLAATSYPSSVFFDGLIYLVRPGRPELPEGAIDTCTPTDCNGMRPKVFVNGRMGPTNLVIDRTGLTWLEVTDPTIGAVVYSIRTCPVSGCVGGPRLLASNTKARSMVADESFVYWINGAPGDPGTSPIMRVAK